MSNRSKRSNIMSNRNTNNDEIEFSLDDVPRMSEGLPSGDPLLSSVSGWASQSLQIYNATRTAETTPPTTTAGREPPNRGLKRLSLLSNKPCCRTRRFSRRSENPSRDVIACPYYKSSPQRYHSCGYAVNIRNARAARHHVVIDHHAPISCIVCHSQFPSAVARDEHERSRTCSKEEREGKSIEGVTADQVPKLLQRDAGKGPRRIHENEQDNWFRMWDMLFPGVQRPETAYMSSPKEREIVALRRFWKRVGPTIVKELLGNEVDEGTLQGVQASILEKMVEEAEL